MAKDITGQTQIIQLHRAHFADAIQVLTAAFRSDPMIAHLFPGEDSALFFEFLLMKSELLNESLYGLVHNTELVGVACVESPLPRRPSVFQFFSFMYQSLRLMFKIPLRKFIFINQYMKSTSDARPKAPHHYLIFLGVHPSHQGKGFGKLLLDHIHNVVKGESASHGIGLDTENPKNPMLYEQFGYRLTNQKTMEEITIYNMFKPNDR